jgi:PBP1b-binding outer membrane lipoprotein LpoB
VPTINVFLPKSVFREGELPAPIKRIINLHPGIRNTLNAPEIIMITRLKAKLLRNAVSAEMITNAKNTALNEREIESFRFENDPAANNEITTMPEGTISAHGYAYAGNEKNLPERMYAAKRIVARTIQKSKMDTRKGLPYLIIAAIILRASIAISIIDSNRSDPW